MVKLVTYYIIFKLVEKYKESENSFLDIFYKDISNDEISIAYKIIEEIESNLSTIIQEYSKLT